MADWEDEDAAPVVSLAPRLPAASRFADEDKDLGPVKESWDADEDEEAAAKAKAAPAPAAKKPATPTPAAAAKPKVAAADAPPPGETEAERKLRLQKAQESADLKHATELFGDLPGAATAAEFTRLATVVAEKLLAHERKPEYVPFLERLVRDLCANQRSDDVRKVASILNVLANERQKEEKAREAGGAKKKATAGAKKATLKTEARGDYDEADDDGGRYRAQDDYDFM